MSSAPRPRLQHRQPQADAAWRARGFAEFLVLQRWISLNLAGSPWQLKMMNTLQRRLCSGFWIEISSAVRFQPSLLWFWAEEADLKR